MIILLLAVAIVNSSTLIVGGKKIEIEENVEAVLNGHALLPCNLTTSPLDRALLVLWYREHSGIPIYSFDTRGLKEGHGKHWPHEAGGLGPRAFFQETTEGRAGLLIKGVLASDSGVYTCRVDFEASPTRKSAVHLSVIVPPGKPVIINHFGKRAASTVGPYQEGDTLHITCLVNGGDPPPNVTWWNGDRLMTTYFHRDGQNVTRSELTMHNLQRNELHTPLTCQAENTPMVAPSRTTVTIEMNLRPMGVKIDGLEDSLSAGSEYTVECRVFGSRPISRVMWFKNGEPLSTPRYTITSLVSPDNNVTTSTLLYKAAVEDQGKQVSCTAENPNIPGIQLQDSTQLQINYAPVARVVLGASLQPDDIREGADVYLECRVKASPPLTSISWTHENKVLNHNTSVGIILSNQTLVLQRLTRHSSGDYTCVAKNNEGIGTSQPLALRVKYAPVCVSRPQVFGAARREPINALCEVKAYPHVRSFKWSFNNSAEVLELNESHFTVGRTTSEAKYTPTNELDYGSLLCWGVNEMGKQKTPCVTHVVPAGRPEPVTDCSISNITIYTLLLVCLPGFNGGLPQMFHLEVYSEESNRLVANMSRSNPEFELRDLQRLPADSRVMMLVYASNAKGRSHATKMFVHTLPGSQENAVVAAQKTDVNLTLVATALIGCLIVLVVVVAVILLLRTQRDSPRQRSPEVDSKGKLPAIQVVDYVDPEQNPDLIPKTYEEVSGGQRAYSALRRPNVPLSPEDNYNHPSVISPASISGSSSMEKGELIYADLSFNGRGGGGGSSSQGGHNPPAPTSATQYAQIDHALTQRCTVLQQQESDV